MTTRIDYLIGRKVRFDNAIVVVIGEVVRIDNEDGLLVVIVKDELTGMLWGAVSSQLEFVDY